MTNDFDFEKPLNLKNRKQYYDERIGTQLHNTVAWMESCRRLIEEAAYLVRCREASRGFENHPHFGVMKRETDEAYQAVCSVLEEIGALTDHRSADGPNGWAPPNELLGINLSKPMEGSYPVVDLSGQAFADATAVAKARAQTYATSTKGKHHGE